MGEPLFKRQRSTSYGKNPLGITVARDHTPQCAACNICQENVYPGRRIINDERLPYPEKWCKHLECARLDLFTEDDRDKCTLSVQG